MNIIKLFEQFSPEEFELNKIYENWRSENIEDLRMIIEQLEDDEKEEEEEPTDGNVKKKKKSKLYKKVNIGQG